MSDVYCERVLTLCRWGLVRSVALRRVLIDELGVDCLAAGIQKNSRETLRLLSDWADVIVLSSRHLLEIEQAEELPPGKLWVLDLGGDRWQNPRHQELHKLCHEHLAPLLAHLRHTRAANKPRSSRIPDPGRT